MPIKWEDPPPTASRGVSKNGATRRFVEELKQNPGKWALYKEASPTPSIAAYLTSRYGCETTTRKNPDGTVRIYARVLS